MAWKYKEPHQRPSWWTAEKVLECLRNGERVSKLCARAAAEVDGAISPERLRADITKWTQSLSWGEQYTAALAIWTRGATPKISTDWYDDFYEAMREADGKVADACQLAGIGPDLVYALRDKRNGCFDKEFDEQVRILEGLRFSAIRENLLKQAAVDSADGGKLAAKVLESAMPGLHAPKQQLEVSGKIEHEHQHFLPPEVIAAAQARIGSMLASRREASRRALPEPAGRTIDVTPVRVKEQA